MYKLYHQVQLLAISGEKVIQRPPAKTARDIELEKQAIIDTLAKTKGNREKTAKILGIGERTLYRKIKEYHL